MVIIIDLYKKKFNSYYESLIKNKDEVKDESLKKQIDDIMKEKEALSKIKTIKEAFDLTNV